MRLLIKNFTPDEVMQALGEFALRNQGIELQGSVDAHLRTTTCHHGELVAMRLEIELPECIQDDNWWKHY